MSNFDRSLCISHLWIIVYFMNNVLFIYFFSYWIIENRKISDASPNKFYLLNCSIAYDCKKVFFKLVLTKKLLNKMEWDEKRVWLWFMIYSGNGSLYSIFLFFCYNALDMSVQCSKLLEKDYFENRFSFNEVFYYVKLPKCSYFSFTLFSLHKTRFVVFRRYSFIIYNFNYV